MNFDAYVAALLAQKVSLSARLKAASGYVLNLDLNLECDLLRKQIEAINEELSKIGEQS